jgi:hypothetical protein
MKKTILFIADRPDWAYEFMIKAFRFAKRL